MKLISFKPLKPFFFGGEVGFGDDYIAKSKYFPQTTQLLGAIRLFILEKKSLIKVYKNGRYVRDYSKTPQEDESIKKAIELVGDENNLGKIKLISPMFVIDKNNLYYPTPFDIQKIDGEYKILEYKKIGDIKYLKNYKAKEGLKQYLGGKKFWESYVNNKIDSSDLKDFDDIFIEVSKVGIGVDKKENIEGMFYVKKAYLLKEGYKLACFIDFDDEFNFNGKITLGADGSVFEINEEKIDNYKLHVIYKAFCEDKKFFSNKKVAISDVFYPESVKAEFKIIPQSSTFEIIDKTKDTFKGKKESKRIYKRGCVFYNATLPSVDGIYKLMQYNKFI